MTSRFPAFLGLSALFALGTAVPACADFWTPAAKVAEVSWEKPPGLYETNFLYDSRIEVVLSPLDPDTAGPDGGKATYQYYFHSQGPDAEFAATLFNALKGWEGQVSLLIQESSGHFVGVKVGQTVALARPMAKASRARAGEGVDLLGRTGPGRSFGIRVPTSATRNGSRSGD